MADVALQDFFGVRFTFFRSDEDGWPRVVPTAFSSAAACQNDACQSADADRDSSVETSLIEAYLSKGDPQFDEPRLLDASDGRPVLILPIRQHGNTDFFAVATFDTPSPDLLVRLARAFLREWDRREEIEQLQEENEHFVEQVSSDFEELDFLRSAAEALQISNLSYGLVEMAKDVLPRLNQSARAKGMFLVAADQDAANGKTDAEQSDQLPAVGSILTQTGPEPVAEDICIRLVECYRAEAVDYPVVRNAFHQSPEGEAFAGVRQFVLVPLNNAQQCLGWLVAVNLSSNLMPGEVTRWELGHHEFGTNEASLMGVAASILATHATNVDLFREMERLLIGVVRSMVSAIDAKDEYTRGHSERVGLYGECLTRQLGYSGGACERMYLTGLLHDVGKIGVSDAILKKEDRLTDEEFVEIQRHPDEAWAILKDLKQLKYVLPGVLYHHEQYDGNGYPDGLVGKKIPIDGRILAIVDTYDAMTSDRTYRKGMTQEKAEAVLREGAGTQWDAELIDAFLAAMPDIIRIREEYQPRAKAVRNEQPSQASGACGGETPA
jgi:HD-GYP domain-containing protein (c-di-GMP phosphodiesterase class II)